MRRLALWIKEGRYPVGGKNWNDDYSPWFHSDEIHFKSILKKLDYDGYE